ncbi:MAG: hypothetical protein ACOH2V_00815 [Candidatus Saccharimonadaceae bacterium]
MKAYLIYDGGGELVDVLNFSSSEELEKYKKANPANVVQVETDLSNYTIEDEEDNLYYSEDGI